MRPSDSAQKLDVLRSCSTAVRDWYLSNSLLLNADKSQAVVLGTANQLNQRSRSTPSKWLGVILDQRLTLNEHATAVVNSCN